ASPRAPEATPAPVRAAAPKKASNTNWIAIGLAAMFVLFVVVSAVVVLVLALMSNKSGSANAQQILAPVAGTVVQVKVQPATRVHVGDELVVLLDDDGINQP